jgi:hypothetical protein
VEGEGGVTRREAGVVSWFRKSGPSQWESSSHADAISEWCSASKGTVWSRLLRLAKRRSEPIRPIDLSPCESGATGPPGHGRVCVHVVNRKQGARLDGHAVGRVDRAPSFEFGEEQG